MKIGVVADTHNAFESAQTAIEALKKKGARVFFHCGDITDFDMIYLFEGIKTYFVRGNNDFDDYLPDAVKKTGGVWLDDGGIAEIGELRIAVTHGHLPGLVKKLLNEEPDFLFLGHSHQKKFEQEGRTKILNPGALFRASPRTCALLNTATGKPEFIEVH